MSTLPVPGGILAGVVPPQWANMAGPPTGQPGAAVAAPQAPVPSVASPPPIAGLNTDVAPAIMGPGMGDAAASLLADQPAPIHHGILGAIQDKLADPMFRAQALRFGMGAMAPGTGGGLGNAVSGGLRAATAFTEERRAQQEKANEFQQEMGLKGRLAANEEKNTDNVGQHYQRSDNNEANRNDQTFRLGEDQVGAQLHGQNQNFQLGVLGQATTRRGQDIGASTERRGQDTQASIAQGRNTTDLAVGQGNNQATIAAATIGAGKADMVKPGDAVNDIMAYLPSMVKGFPTDPKSQPEAWADVPSDVQTGLTNAYIQSRGDMAKFGQEAQRLLGTGASYTPHDFTHNYIPGTTDPGYHGGQGGGQSQPAASASSQSEVRYDAQGQAYTKGSNGAAVRAPQFDRR